MTKIDYLIIGHLTADLIPNGRILGGTCSYAARTAQAFGLNVGVLTSAAENDPLLDELGQYAEVISVPAAETTTYDNIYTPEGRKQYLHKIASPITAQHIPAAWQDVPLVHIAPMADEISTDVVGQFKASQQILVTPQGWMRRRDADNRVLFKNWFDADMLKQVKIVVFSEEDIVAAPDLEAKFAQSVPICIMTRSYNGGVYYVDGVQAVYEAVAAESVDPTGAGDIFASSFFAAYYQLQSVESAVQVAATLAAHSISRSGLKSTPTPEEVQNAMKVYDRQNPL